jgi:hypothetical protein
LEDGEVCERPHLKERELRRIAHGRRRRAVTEHHAHRRRGGGIEPHPCRGGGRALEGHRDLPLVDRLRAHPVQRRRPGAGGVRALCPVPVPRQRPPDVDPCPRVPAVGRELRPIDRDVVPLGAVGAAGDLRREILPLHVHDVGDRELEERIVVDQRVECRLNFKYLWLGTSNALFAGRKSMDGPVGCQGHERSVQDRGLLGPFIDPKRPDPTFWLLVECRTKGGSTNSAYHQYRTD